MAAARAGLEKAPLNNNRSVKTKKFFEKAF
jgi:hypothetical protein